MQPQESDERGSEYDNDDDDKESSDDNNERVTPESAQTTHIVGIHSESLAKLEEPTYEESEVIYFQAILLTIRRPKNLFFLIQF